MAKWSSVNPCGEIYLDGELKPCEIGNRSGMTVPDALKDIYVFSPDEMPDVECQFAIIHEAKECRFWGVNDNRVITLGLHGRVTLVVHENGLVSVTYIPHYTFDKDDTSEWWFGRAIQFWATTDELQDLGRWLRQKLANKVSFDKIYDGVLRG